MRAAQSRGRFQENGNGREGEEKRLAGSPERERADPSDWFIAMLWVIYWQSTDERKKERAGSSVHIAPRLLRRTCTQEEPPKRNNSRGEEREPKHEYQAHRETVHRVEEGRQRRQQQQQQQQQQHQRSAGRPKRGGGEKVVRLDGRAPREDVQGRAQAIRNQGQDGVSSQRTGPKGRTRNKWQRLDEGRKSAETPRKRSLFMDIYLCDY